MFVTAVGVAAVVLRPSDDLQSIVDAHPSGTTYQLVPGLYRQATVVPKSHDVFVGASADHTTLTGARILNNFERDPGTGLFVAWNQTQRGQVHGICAPGYPRCDRPEDLYFDDVPLLHVNATSDVRHGTWFFDYDRQRILCFDDPTNHTVETSVTRVAFAAPDTVTNVTIAELSVTKYAIPAQMGAIGDQHVGVGWKVENVSSRLNHGAGVRLNGGSAFGCDLTRNGQQGVACGGVGCHIAHNVIAKNNWAGFSTGWEAGGGKMSRTTGLVVEHNVIHDNLGPGIWTDIDNLHATYRGNLVYNNAGDGIKHEISYDAHIVDNVCCLNGRDQDVWLWGSNVLVQNSRNVVVSGNTIVVGRYGNAIGLIQQSRGSGHGPGYGPHLTYNNLVANNTVVYLASWGKSAGGNAGGSAGVVADYKATGLFEHGGNRFERNRWHMANVSDARRWAWNESKDDFGEWNAAGFDLLGTVDDSVPKNLPVVCSIV